MRQATIVEYERGETICRVGGDRLAIRYISSGCAAIYLPTADGREVMFATLFRGTIVNVVDLIEGSNQHNMRAISKTIVYELGPKAFEEQGADPQFLRWCMWLVTRNVLMLAEFASVRGIQSADMRLMEFLKVAHFQQTGKHPKGPFSVEWPLSQQVLAYLINLSRPYLNERIRHLEALGIIRFAGNRIHVLKPVR